MVRVVRQPWKAPRDLDRSLNTRSCGLMSKAMELANMDVQVAIFVQGRGRKIQFTTHPDFVPEWNAADITDRPQPDELLSGRARSFTAPPESTSATSMEHFPESSPFMPDLEQFELSLPQAQPTSDDGIEPWELLRPLVESTSTCGSDSSVDSATGDGTVRKRRHASQPALSRNSSGPQKRLKRVHGWFDD